MASEAGGDARSIGARLRGAREKRGLTILQAAEKLHVDARVLEALEAGNFAALGAPVYVRGHLRRYAELLGEPPPQLTEFYAAAPAPDLTRIPHREPDRDSSLVLPALIVLGVFAAVGLLWWVMTLPGVKSQPVAQPPAAAAPAAGVASEGPAAVAVPAPEPGAVAAPAGTHLAAATAMAAAPGEARLALRFSDVSWVEVYDAGGRRLLEGLGAADSARTLSGAPPLRVVLGNAPAVAMQLNGRPVTLDGLVHRDHSARFVLDAAGHAAPAPAMPGPGG
jgi:cytoskeleton protein RodZ